MLANQPRGRQEVVLRPGTVVRQAMSESQTKQSAEMVRVAIWVAFADDPDGLLERLYGLLVASHADQLVPKAQIARPSWSPSASAALR